jgi:hypothetical protein
VKYFYFSTLFAISLSKESLDFLQKLETEKVKKILIESVIALDGTGEKKISGLVINLK